MPQAKTIKQAKAAYKTRNTANPLTEREQKQLKRSLQLDRRAWSLREREKNRADAVKKRAEREKKASEERTRLGTQVRVDKFGYKSSQFHLGAFFGKAGGGPKEGSADVKEVRKEHPRVVLEELRDDEFEDLDDESLLKALDSPEADRRVDATSIPQAETLGLPANLSSSPGSMMPLPPRSVAFMLRDLTDIAAQNTLNVQQLSPTDPAPKLRHHSPLVSNQALPLDDTEMHWNDFLSTSTQIARELDFNDHQSQETTLATVNSEKKDDLRTTSFSSGFFDFTEEDLEELDPLPNSNRSPQAEAQPLNDRAKMPPPALTMLSKDPYSKPQSVPTKPQRNTSQQPIKTTLQCDPAFTLTQLESFMDDDLQLTQLDTQ